MSDLAQAHRPLMWNISDGWLMYVLFLVALGVFAYGVYQRVSYWRQGRGDDERLADWGRRAVLLVKELVLQTRVRESRFPGVFHSLLFYSFAVLVVTTAVVAIDYDFGTTIFVGWTYVVLSVAAEAAGVLILVGVGMAAWRRYVSKPDTLTTTLRDLVPLLLVGAITVTGFLAEGIRIATLGDPWAALTPVGGAIAALFGPLSAATGEALHVAVWWSHTVLALAWIATIPYTKFVHLLSLPTNVFFQKLKPRGELRRLDLLALMEREDFNEDNFRVGVEKTSDFTWKQRLDFDACLSCGRCEAVCPARQAGAPFSPKQFIARCKELLEAAESGRTAAPASEAGDGPDSNHPVLVGEAFDEAFIWHCRTCTACMEVCPACVDHVDTLVEVRRNEVLIQGRMPADAARALRQLETRGNPFGRQEERLEFARQSGLRIVGPGEECDVIYWVGCCTTFDPTKQKIATDLCKLLTRCGIDFGILGGDERCCGDPARVLGDERLFQDAAKHQIEVLQSRTFKVLLTSCPHCYNVLKNEYPQFGATFKVVHHAEFLHEMLWSGDLRPRFGIPRKVVFHDPCYLGRYQKMYESPREVVRAIPGTKVLEMKDAREHSMCCGGGGGHFWMDLRASARINNLRVEQAREAGADTIVTACAFCNQMLSDSVKLLDLQDEVEVIDLATLVAGSLPHEEQRPEPRETPVARDGTSG